MGNKLIITAVLFICSSYVASIANALENKEESYAEGLYFYGKSVKLLPSLQVLDEYSASSYNENNYKFSVSLGYKPKDGEGIFSGAKLETEVSFNNLSAQNIGIGPGASELDIMENAFYNFDNTKDVHPYLGAGVGVANIGRTVTGNAEHNGGESFSLPAYQAMTGVLFQSETYPDASAHMGYKYFATIGRQTTNAVNEPYAKNNYSQNFEAGVKVDF